MYFIRAFSLEKVPGRCPAFDRSIHIWITSVPENLVSKNSMSEFKPQPSSGLPPAFLSEGYNLCKRA